MKHQAKCTSCGHAIVAYTYSLNVGKVNALRRLVDEYERTREPVELGNLGLSNAQYTNFCHLAYFDLARHIEGGWIPTVHGTAFVYGDAEVTMPVAVMGGNILSDDHEAWQTQTRPRKRLRIGQISEVAYKKRPEYATEKRDSLFS